MARRPGPASCLQILLKRMFIRRLLRPIACITFLALIWIHFPDATSPEQPITDNLIQEAIENAERDARYSEVYRKASRLSKELKYILLWTDTDYAPFYYFGHGQKAFIEKNCSMINCYVTSDRKFFDHTTQFDAIAFNGRNLNENLPEQRSEHQKFIYFNMESSENFPVCNEKFDGFFNWTSTYRLDSDIPYPYIMVKNKIGEVIAPKKKVAWPNFSEVSEEYAEKLGNKTKAAAWFVSSCKSRSGRQDMVKRLEKALEIYKHKVDVYGKCGPLDCPRDRKGACDVLIERDYYFYLSLENSFAEDYVTEKLLTALQHDAVPIVYGGANYSRFLPPGSYIDASLHTASELAATMDRVISSPKLYRNFFRWKSRLTYSDPSAKANVCNLCTAMNDERIKETTVYENFREWWHPNYKERCSLKLWN